MHRTIEMGTAGQLAVRLIVALAASLALLPAGVDAAERATIKVTVKPGGSGWSKGGENGLLICAQSKRGEVAGSFDFTGKQCATTKNGGKATLRPKPGRYFIRVYGGLGGGPCYAKSKQGFKPGECTRIRAKSGKTKRITWKMPLWG